MSSKMYYDLFMQYSRRFVEILRQRIQGNSPLIQVVLGPRQVGKTTGVKQLISQYTGKSHYAHADDLLAPDRSWVLEQWQKALSLGNGTLLIIDEIQKVPNWSEVVKKLWDDEPNRIKLIVLGSSSLLLQKGLSESLAGRFELLRVLQWSFTESKEAFNYDLNQFLKYGGYPGAVPFESDYDRWYSYIKDSIVESAISKDIIQDNRVGNPALFRQAFEILCSYPSQEISYTKLLGQLQNKGNSDLVKHYIQLYCGAFLLTGLQKYSHKAYLSRSSSPKILLGCPALISMYRQPRDTDKELFGRLLEQTVGNRLISLPGEVYFWRDRSHELDFVFKYHGEIYAIEVKSGRMKPMGGLSRFCSEFPESKSIVITKENFEIFDHDPIRFLQEI